MPKKSLALTLSLMCLVFTSCATQTIRFDDKERDTESPTVSEMQHYFLFGILPRTQEIDVKRLCGGKQPTQIQSRSTFLDTVLNIVTLGLYSPRTARIWCD